MPLPVLLGVFPPNPFVSGLVTSHKKPISDSSPVRGAFALGVVLQSLVSRVRLIAVEASIEIGKQAVRGGRRIRKKSYAKPLGLSAYPVPVLPIRGFGAIDPKTNVGLPCA